MHRLALIGRHISHSRSPELYQKLIGPHISYDLIDIQSEDKLPSIEYLQENYDGVNITSPWKKYYSQYAIEDSKKWNAVNCLRFKRGICEATNTDASALRVLIPLMMSEHHPQHWVILGDGVMGEMTCQLLIEMNHSVSVYSRRKGDKINQMNLKQLYPQRGVKVVVNACSRDFYFEGIIDGDWVFWDLNYAHGKQSDFILKQNALYVDGLSLLETQAQHAVMFWES